MKLSEILAQAIESSGVNAKWKKEVPTQVRLEQTKDLAPLVKKLSKAAEFRLLEGVVPTKTVLYFLLFSQRYNLELMLQAPTPPSEELDSLKDQVREALRAF